MIKQGLRVMSVEEYKNTPYYLLPPRERRFIEMEATRWIPAINPPFGAHKRDRFPEVENVRSLATDQFSQTDELTIIGCSLRDEDSVLEKMLKNNLQDNIHVNIVTPSGKDKIKNKIEACLSRPTFNTNYNYFREYISNEQ